MKVIAMTPIQEFVFYRTYSRWIPELNRRERWEETVERYFNFFKAKFIEKVPKKVWDLSQQAVLNMDVMPSMRALWAAGPALQSNHITGYNCCSLVFKDLFSPVELFYILMCGAGVGFSVERQFIEQMPIVCQFSGQSIGTHIIGDSREGWADALKISLATWFSGKDVELDYSKIRPRGATLKTMGGQASGPEPLRKLLDFTRDLIFKNQGRKLTSTQWLDIGNMIAEVVVVGGVRRSSEITFSDLEDVEMQHAKDFPIPPHRFMSNNSAVYHGKPDLITFMKEWTALAASGSGERGIFNLDAAMKSSNRRATSKLGQNWEKLGQTLRTNPCGEINLLADMGQFCNLTEVVVRADDSIPDLQEKIKSAVWMGVMQSCLTDFPYIRPSFKAACDEERLLGLSLTGQMDNPQLMSEDRLEDLKALAIRECRKACKILDINMSAAITTGKPSGTVSQLVNSASGAHPRFAKYYIRRVRISATSPLFKVLKECKVKVSPENGQGPEEVTRRRMQLIKEGASVQEAERLVPDWSEGQVMTWVVSFPEAAPKGAVTRHNMSAVEQLEWYLKVKRHWCEHNQSITIYVRENEWLKVGSWVYDHFDEISGVSFLPFDGGHYEQAPYEEITKEVYETLCRKFPKIDYNLLSKYEFEDNTTGAQVLACMSGNCEI